MSPPLNDEQAAKVERNTELVRRLARRLAREIGALPIDELESVGNEALVQSAMRYEPDSAASFATYAYYRVRGAMIDAIRKRTPGRRRYKRALIQLQSSQALLAQAAEDQQARKRAGQRQTLEQRVEQAHELVRRAALVICLTETKGHDVELAVDEHERDPEHALLDEQARERLRASMAELDEDQRWLVEALYFQGRTMTEVAGELGISVATVSRRHTKLIDRLGRLLRPREQVSATKPSSKRPSEVS